jgi:hypothetical protein
MLSLALQYYLTLLYFSVSIYPYYYSLNLLPLPTLLLFQPILVLLCETEQMNYGVFNLFIIRVKYNNNLNRLMNL